MLWAKAIWPGTLQLKVVASCTNIAWPTKSFGPTIQPIFHPVQLSIFPEEKTVTEEFDESSLHTRQLLKKRKIKWEKS